MSSPTAPYWKPTTPRRGRRGGVVGPLVLIFLGVVFLLQNTGFLPPNFWLNLWRLWPLVLVLAGFELMFAHRVPWLGLAAFAAVLLVGGGFAVQHTRQAAVARPMSVSRTAQTDLGDAAQAQVAIHFGAGQLDVRSLAQPTSSQLAVLTYDGLDDIASKARYTVDHGVGRLRYDFQGTDRGAIPFVSGGSNPPRMQLELSPRVPLDSVTVETGATDAHLDLSDLQLKSVDMSVGAATAWVRLPQGDGTSTVRVRGGAATITLEVPQGVAATIRHRGGLSTLTIDGTRFPKVDDTTYRSPDYDTATRRAEISLETGLTTIQVN